MKIFIKSAAILAALLGSGLTQAANTTASIPMGVEVPKSCSFSDVSSGLVLSEDGSEVQGTYTFKCNIDGGFTAFYSLDSLNNSGNSSVRNTNGKTLPTSVHLWAPNTVLNHTLNGQLNNIPHSFNFNWLNVPIQTFIKVQLVNPTTATTPAGIYTDTFRVNVNY
ncbi:Csu type fimbrial protein [Acinetobacter terrae]|uniref:SCPU domain-containing protein n=1 Tax=Acinetobacter terrae TaxID=2731247 RepID=A0A8E4H5S2_9GAMM|nr:hypothetical protein [Acinetobacter terrae]NNH40068.1 hypothetical protein [Acinetobacter terrae]OAL87769.1 hypothetical protein AY608_10650 [Acinetobacter terrae]